jgi:hypothetical protein
MNRALLLATIAVIAAPPAALAATDRDGAAPSAAEEVRPLAAAQPAQTGSAAGDAPLPAFRADLIDLAFAAATAIPVDPHVKDRSRAQEAVVAVCLELDQAQRALGCIEAIEGWRRGAAYADLAAHGAQRSRAAQAEEWLRRAEAAVEGIDDWRRDRVRLKIARAYALLGRDGEAALIASGVAGAESAAAVGAQAMLDGEAFAAHVARLAATADSGNLDLARSAMSELIDLFDRSFGDERRRAEVEHALRTAGLGLPHMVRFELTIEMAGVAIDHGDRAKALDLVDDAQRTLKSSRWTPEYEVGALARLAGVRSRAGDEARAREEIAAATQLLQRERAKIASVDHVAAILPLAEAHWAMGDGDAARTVYGAAVAECAGNPNARPRALDLSAICRSMAAHGVAPDAELWRRMQDVHRTLGPPW